jgi:hypothetical protein
VHAKTVTVCACACYTPIGHNPDRAPGSTRPHTHTPNSQPEPTTANQSQSQPQPEPKGKRISRAYVFCLFVCLVFRGSTRTLFVYSK